MQKLIIESKSSFRPTLSPLQLQQMSSADTSSTTTISSPRDTSQQVIIKQAPNEYEMQSTQQLTPQNISTLSSQFIMTPSKSLTNNGSYNNSQLNQSSAIDVCSIISIIISSHSMK